MKRLAFGVVAAAAAFAAPAQAAFIAPGGATSYNVPGTTSIYQIFGNNGAPGGGGAASDALLTTFAAGAGNVFSFTASGEIGCCGSVVTGWGPDGNPGTTGVLGANGLSGLEGDARIPLVGVFTTDTDPAGGVAPAPLVFTRFGPFELTPVLNQVFYIGDGRTGFDNAGGTIVNFTAPTNATRLYLGTIDAFGFGGQSGFYADNPGSFDVDVDVSLAARSNGAVPEPATWAMMIMGFGLIGGAMRRRKYTQRVTYA